jgi:hypothetical protein
MAVSILVSYPNYLPTTIKIRQIFQVQHNQFRFQTAARFCWYRKNCIVLRIPHELRSRRYTFALQNPFISMGCYLPRFSLFSIYLRLLYILSSLNRMSFFYIES